MNLFINDHAHRTGISIHFEQLPIVERARRGAYRDYQISSYQMFESNSLVSTPALASGASVGAGKNTSPLDQQIRLEKIVR
jgi:hypothetical protein